MPEAPAAPPPPAPPEAPPVQPRSEAPPPEGGAEKAAEEARVKVAKTEGFWNQLIPKKEGEEKPAAKPAATATAKEKPAEPKAEEPKPRRRRQEVDPIELATATGRAIASELHRANQPPPPKPEPEPEIPEEFKRDMPVFEVMSRENPQKYGNLKKEVAKYAKAESDYIATWEKDNPGETFDGEALEHDEFYKKIKPDYDHADFEAAKDVLIEERAAKRAKEEYRKEHEVHEQRRERVAQISPELNGEIVSLLGQIVKEVDPENAALGKDWESLKTLDEKNPLLADVMVEVHNQVKPLLEANMRLFRQIDTPDQNNAAHARIFSLIAEAQDLVQRLPVKDRYDEGGRLFATHEDYAKMPAAEQARHWYVGETELAGLIRRRAVGQVKVTYEHEAKRIARYTNGAAVQIKGKPDPAKPAPNTVSPPSTRADVSSPSFSGRATLPGDGQAAGKTPSSGKDWFFNRYLTGN